MWWDTLDAEEPLTNPVTVYEPIFRQYKGCPPFPTRRDGLARAAKLGLFFDARTPSAGQSNAIDGTTFQPCRKFITATADRLGMQPGNLGYQPNSSMPPLRRLMPGHPAALLLVQTTENQFQPPMFIPLRMIPCPTR